MSVQICIQKGSISIRSDVTDTYMFCLIYIFFVFDVDDDEYWYINDQYNRVSRFFAGYVPEEERGTFGWDEDPVENFEDMRRRIGDQEVLVWMSYSNWEKLEADKHRKA